MPNELVQMPKMWEPRQVAHDCIPTGRPGDLRHNGHYCYRGIPFTLPFQRNAEGFYITDIEYWNPFISRWNRLGVSLGDDRGWIVYSEIIEKLTPYIDILIGANQKLVWN